MPCGFLTSGRQRKLARFRHVVFPGSTSSAPEPHVCQIQSVTSMARTGLVPSLGAVPQDRAADLDSVATDNAGPVSTSEHRPWTLTSRSGSSPIVALTIGTPEHLGIWTGSHAHDCGFDWSGGATSRMPSRATTARETSRRRASARKAACSSGARSTVNLTTGMRPHDPRSAVWRPSILV